MANSVNGNTQITAHYFGHSAAVADTFYVKAIPEVTAVAALALDAALGNKGQISDNHESKGQAESQQVLAATAASK